MQTKKTLLNRLIAGTATLALLAAPVFAQSNEIATVDFAAEVANGAVVNTAFTFTVPNTTPDSTLSLGDSIVVRVPGSMTIDPQGYNDDAANDAVFTSNGTVGNGTVAYDATSKEITYTLAGADAIVEGETITLTLNNDFITTPAADSASGQYAFSIRLEDDANVVLATGAALLAVNNTVDVEASVQEAIIMTVSDTSLNLAVDPSANNGEDISQSTDFTINSNAAGGFVVRAAINQALTGADYGDTIANATGGGENTFAYGATVGANDHAFGAEANTFITDLVATDAGARESINAHNIGTFQDTIHYYLNVDYTTAADTYNATITYTAFPTF